MNGRVEGLVLALLLATILGMRCWNPGQPIVENYVGRQIPTAMVARNLDRGSGFLRPQLDTGPFPNYFLVEPPVYQALVVGLKRGTGLALEPAGRIVSALATTLAALGLFGLARKRERAMAALLAVAAFGLLPVTIRYGRAFQPDALMLGLSVAGLAAWDRGWGVAGWLGSALGWAVKIIAAHLVVPLVVVLGGKRKWPRRAILAASMTVPALAWYIHAAGLMGEGSRASAQNAAIWGGVLSGGELLARLGPGELIGAARWWARVFSPLGLLLAGFGWTRRGGDRLWLWWWLAVGATAAVLVRKMHHEYYGLMFAPLVALGIGRALAGLAGRGGAGRLAAGGLGMAAGALGLWQAAPTWATPYEWRDLGPAAAEVRRVVPAGDWLISPEALLYQADRKGCRMEWSRGARVRAASEWDGIGLRGARAEDPIALVEFYRLHGARWFAELPGRLPPGVARQLARRYRVASDRPEVFLLELTPTEGDAEHGRP